MLVIVPIIWVIISPECIIEDCAVNPFELSFYIIIMSTEPITIIHLVLVDVSIHVLTFFFTMH